MDFTVITVTNRRPSEPYYFYDSFLKSLSAHGVDPLILGFGDPWYGLMTKPRTLLRWLRSNAEKPECLIVVDSWDLVFCRHPREIATAWHEIGRPFIIGGERALFPGDLGEKNFPQCASSFRFPNSGFIIATPSDMIAVLEAMDLPSISDDYYDASGTGHHENDQFHYQRVFLKQPVPMLIDTEAKFVWNLCGVEESNLNLSFDIPRNLETGNFPGAIHANGGSKGEPIFARVLDHLKLR